MILTIKKGRMVMKPSLVVMAAGIGSRYGGLKQMDPVGPTGEWIIEYSIYDAIKAGFDRVVFIINQKIEKDFKEIVGQKLDGQIQIDYVIQSLEDVPTVVPENRVKPWGTAHAIYATREVVKGPFAVINADDFYGRDAFKKVYDFLVEEGTNYALIGYALKNTLTDHGSVARGVCVEKSGLLKDVTERVHIEKTDTGAMYLENEIWHEISPESTVSMNMWGFQYSILQEIQDRLSLEIKEILNENPLKGEFFLPKVVDDMIKNDRVDVAVIKTPEKWFGVTYAEDKEGVVKAIRTLVDEGVYPEALWEG